MLDIEFFFFGLMNINAILSHCVHYNNNSEMTKLFWTLDVICTSIASYYLAIASVTDYYEITDLSYFYMLYIPICILTGFYTSYNDTPYWAEVLYVAVLGILYIHIHAYIYIYIHTYTYLFV